MKSKSNSMDKELQQDRLQRSIDDLCNAIETLKRIRRPESILKIVKHKTNGVSKVG